MGYLLEDLVQQGWNPVEGFGLVEVDVLHGVLCVHHEIDDRVEVDLSPGQDTADGAAERSLVDSVGEVVESIVAAVGEPYIAAGFELELAS